MKNEKKSVAKSIHTNHPQNLCKVRSSVLRVHDVRSSVLRVMEVRSNVSIVR